MNSIVRILTPILSAVVFSLCLVSDTVYFSSVILVSLPVFIILGTMFSITVDNYLSNKMIDNKFKKYIVTFVLYGLGGIFIILLFSVVQGSISEIAILPLLVLGAFPGLIYFHIRLLLTTLWKRATHYLKGDLETNDL